MGKSLHKARPIRPAGTESFDGWRVKLYSICQEEEFPGDEYLERLREIVRATLPRPAVTDERPGVGFAVVHRARPFNQIIVDWWERENELRHRVFKAEPSRPLEFADITHTGEAFCVWELRVIEFERGAWMATVLCNPDGASLDAYLEITLNEDS